MNQNHRKLIGAVVGLLHTDVGDGGSARLACINFENL
jgi:hypothetical protein